MHVVFCRTDTTKQVFYNAVQFLSVKRLVNTAFAGTGLLNCSTKIPGEYSFFGCALRLSSNLDKTSRIHTKNSPAMVNCFCNMELDFTVFKKGLLDLLQQITSAQKGWQAFATAIIIFIVFCSRTVSAHHTNANRFAIAGDCCEAINSMNSLLSTIGFLRLNASTRFLLHPQLPAV